MTTETTAQPLPRRSESGMHSRAINAAAGILQAAKEQGRQFPIGVAIALDAAGLLNSPERAREFERMKERLAVLEAAHNTAPGPDEAELPIAYALTEAADELRSCCAGPACTCTPLSPQDDEYIPPNDAPALKLPAIAVTCPYCAAQPGDLCTSHSGTRLRRKDIHRHRTLAWKNAEADGITRRIAPTQAHAVAEDPCHPCGCPKRFNRHAWGCPTLAAKES